ncbi:MAG: hypothetical protein V2J24_22330 [Pseudomonadales bacterium]|jgi:hypothetical protein|nr:hypothetical protein [Pseudomonadales bacterium]
MFHLLVSYGGWDDATDSIDIGRCFEYTEKELLDRFKPGGVIAVDQLPSLPALIMSETGGSGPQIARIGRIYRAWVVGKELRFEYGIDDSLPQLSNDAVEELSRQLGIDDFEFHRSHWAIKSADLFQVLLRSHQKTKPQPRVFRFDTVDGVDPDLLSLMMPFATAFDDVHVAVREAAESQGMQCLRADDIWDEDAVIQDVVSLLARSKVVVCDCTGRNANVFYEAGIAHSLGRDVILITQSGADIPFDLRHLRYVEYENNEAGRAELAERVARRIETLRRRDDA